VVLPSQTEPIWIHAAENKPNPGGGDPLIWRNLRAEPYSVAQQARASVYWKRVCRITAQQKCGVSRSTRALKPERPGRCGSPAQVRLPKTSRHAMEERSAGGALAAVTRPLAVCDLAFGDSSFSMRAIQLQ